MATAAAQETGEAIEPGVLRVFQSKSETAAFYNKIAKVYDLLAEHSEQPVRDTGLRKLAVREGETILEIGFGTGHCLVAIAKAVGASGKACGIDISEEMLKHTRVLAEQEHVAERLLLHCGDATHLPFADASMDGVFMSFTLELFDTPEIPNVLAECRRVLLRGRAHRGGRNVERGWRTAPSSRCTNGATGISRISWTAVRSSCDSGAASRWFCSPRLRKSNDVGSR